VFIVTGRNRLHALAELKNNGRITSISNKICYRNAKECDTGTGDTGLSTGT